MAKAEAEYLRFILDQIVKQADRKFALWKPLFGPDVTKPEAVQIRWALIEKARAALSDDRRPMTRADYDAAPEDGWRYENE